ncbi:MAG: acyltransferase, partial [Beggiatoa sp.]|nr:acyltransferase [Beggiatoa sp.]
MLKLGLIQMSSTDDPDANLDRALAFAREAAARGAQVICLPELFRSRYFCQTEEHRFFDLAEPIPGPSTEAFTALAAQTGVTVIVSVFERRAAGLYHNTAVLIEGAAGCL